ncbi:hypothetical protein F2Y18_26260 [Bacillus cereus]|uniref:hypothetical protein n=1 Tax=Bacillus cereus TaxID=1396 RepID=UPI00122EE3A0|nr:hypothetical protein [Bacillus cereus]KAA2385668.1 hypothetical protein F2Y18_26260 [Bacillus cereus]
MIKLDRTAVDKAIKEMKLFEATKEVLASYEAEKEILEKREEALTERLAQLQEQHTQTLIDREVASDNPSDYIYLSSQLSKIESDMKVLLPLKEALQEEYTLLNRNTCLLFENLTVRIPQLETSILMSVKQYLTSGKN